jgi:hypothetical protein
MAKKIVLSISPRAIVISALVLLALGGGLWAVSQFMATGSFTDRRPELKAVAPLEPVTRTSVVVAPVAVAVLAIRDVMEAKAPRDVNGTHDNPYSDLLGKSEISWSATRGPIQVASAPQGIDISTAVNGSARLSGQTTNSKDNLNNRIGGLLGGRLGRDVQNFAARTLQQTADIRGSITVNAKPALLPNWRIDPNLSGQAAMGDVNFAGFKFNVTNQIKPSLDNAMNEQMGVLSNRLRNDPMLEIAVRPEWNKLCRSISLGQTAPNAPPLWLEVRPTKAIAAQPRFVRDWVILTVGVQAETRIVPNETKPNCPFPARLDIVPQLDQGQISIAVPIDVPIAELNRVMDQQLKGKTFPDDRNSPGEVTVLAANVAASGDRLLVSLKVKARETKSWFGFSTEATVHMWGKPALDADTQIMRLSDVSLDVESETALLGAAARAAMPYVRSALERNAVIDLKPFTANARASVETMLADFKQPIEGVEIEAAITGLRLASIAFDAKTLRVIGEAQGTARALIRKIPLQ